MKHIKRVLSLKVLVRSLDGLREAKIKLFRNMEQIFYVQTHHRPGAGVKTSKPFFTYESSNVAYQFKGKRA